MYQTWIAKYKDNIREIVFRNSNFDLVIIWNIFVVASIDF